MQNDKITLPQLSLPKGGGSIKGIGEIFQSNPFSGTGSFSIPLPVSPSRGFEPSLSLDYGSGNGNGIIGAGFTVSIPNISRRTRLGIPKYDDSDVFVLSGADDLVAKYEQQPDNTRELHSYPDTTNDYMITRYRPRKEGLFAKIEKWVRQSDHDIHWRITTKDNIVNIYGRDTAARIADPADASRVFQWLLEESFNAKGNRIVYEYKREDGNNIPANIQEKGRNATAKVYPTKIKYGNYTPGVVGENDWHFEIIFDYGERDWDIPTYLPPKEWGVRQDAFSSFKAGFEIRTHRLCRGILLFHRFETINAGAPFLVRATKLSYEENTILSLLSKVVETGYRQYGSAADITKKTLPPLELTYTNVDPTFQTRLDAAFFKDKLVDGPLTEELLREFKFKGISVTKDAQLTTIQDAETWEIKGHESNYRLVTNGSYIDVFAPSLQPVFEPLDINIQQGIAGYINQPPFQLIDLQGEGLPGILYAENQTILYAKPQGEGQFSSLKEMLLFPSQPNLGKSKASIMDLDGDGQLNLVLHQAGYTGFYPMTEDGSWGHFRPFSNYPNEYSSQSKEIVDITGDGLADLVTFEDDGVKYYESKGKKGFENPIRRLDNNDLEYTVHRSKQEVYRFADLFGDGSTHLVRIRSGEVACWPNLGHGRFGKKIRLGNAPIFPDRLDPRRLFLVDIDGSGTADIIYAYHDYLAIYYNESGNSFRAAVHMKLPYRYSDIDQIQFADILGTGTACLVMSTKSADASLRHEYYSFTGGKKPHLLSEINNNLGGLSRIHYAPSTKFYLEDQQAGRPWVTKLSFPVQLVERTETTDYFSGNTLVSRFKYHDGYFDPTDRTFRGFGFVERWDTEEYESFLQRDTTREHADYVAPVYTKSWYHTGAFRKAGDISSYYKAAYFQGDTAAYPMPDAVFEDIIGQCDGQTIEQAHWALHGVMLRQEVFGLDTANELNQSPYLVTESNVYVRMIQPRIDNINAIFFTHAREAITYHYERNPADPRIEHEFTLAVDEYGHITKQCTVFYPRRPNASLDPIEKTYDSQLSLKIVANQNRFTNNDGAFFLLGIPVESQQFEIGGLSLAGARYFNFDHIEEQLNEALQDTNRIPFEQVLAGNTKQARLLEWSKHFYWNTDLTAALPLGEVSPIGLPHHNAMAIFSNDLLALAFGDKLPSQWRQTGAMLETQMGYHYEDESQLWWSPGLTIHYLGENAFYLPNKTTDTFGHATTLAYDAAHLIPVAKTDALGNTSTAMPDYYVLHPYQNTDINDNVSQVQFDPLGYVIATSVQGSEGSTQKGDGDIGEYKVQAGGSLVEMLELPHKYLQSASSFLYYELDTWRHGRQPMTTLNVLREIHVSDLPSGEQSPVQLHLAYSDGLGRLLERKVKVESGATSALGASGNIVEQASTDRWLTSGRTVYNNKGKVVKQYEPFYSDGPAYQGETILSQIGVTPVLHYDPLLRLVRVDSPKGFFSQSVFTPWHTKHYDENDTVTDSVYYQQNNGNLPAAKQAALDKAALHYDTPNVQLSDNMGRAFSTIQMLNDDGGAKQFLQTLSVLDIQGHPLRIIDPRLLKRNKEDGVEHCNFEYIYAMSGDVLCEISADSGTNCHLDNAVGQQCWSWTARNYNQLIEYDELNRKKRLYIYKNTAGGAVPTLADFNLVETFIYGEDQPAAKGKNLRGRIYQIKDLSGILTYESYHFTGASLKESRQMSTDYHQPNDWQAATGVDLEPDIYNHTYTYDALGRPTSHSTPDGSITSRTYNQRGLLARIVVQFTNGTEQAVITNINYNAKGQREAVHYGNGVHTRHQYEATTFRRLSCRTTRPDQDQNGHSQEAVLQDIAYVYDPVGNIVQTTDSSYKAVYFNNDRIAPISTYTYDSLYRLTAATGRQQIGVNANAFKNNESDNFFKQSIFRLAASSGANVENYTESYQYDWSGNLIHKKHTAASAVWNNNLAVEDHSNRLLGLAYDESGNLRKLHLNSAVDLSFNCCENLVKASIIKRPGEMDDSDYYTYDWNEMRTRKVAERMAHGGTVSQIEEKIYLGNYEVKRIKARNSANQVATTLTRQTLRIMDDNNCVLTVHYWPQDDQQQEVDQADTRKLRWQLNNHLGSAAMEVNTNAQLISYEEYFPYGGTAMIVGRNEREVKRKEYRYSGKERDDSTGLYYYGARYYAPWMCRWLKPDPAGTVDGLNLYAFVGGNPIKFVDHTGLSKRSAAEAAHLRTGASAVDIEWSGATTTSWYHEELTATATQSAMTHYTPASANTGKHLSRSYPITNQGYRAIHDPNTMPKKRTNSAFSTVPAHEIGFIRGHITPHADTPRGGAAMTVTTVTDVTGTQAVTHSSTLVSTRDAFNFYPEPEGWGEKQRKHRELWARKRETPILQIQEYSASPSLTKNGTPIPERIYFIEFTGLSSNTTYATNKPYDAKAYEIEYAGYDYETYAAKSGDRRVLKPLRVGTLPAHLVANIVREFPHLQGKGTSIGI